jgi:hypothetical protein
MFADSFLRELPQPFNISFFKDHSRPSFGRSRKTVPDLPQWKTNFNIYDDAGNYTADIFRSLKEL